MGKHCILFTALAAMLSIGCASVPIAPPATVSVLVGPEETQRDVSQTEETTRAGALDPVESSVRHRYRPGALEFLTAAAIFVVVILAGVVAAGGNNNFPNPD